MENLSHSRLPNKGSHAAVTKRACNGGKFVGKAEYDDVFGGQQRFGVPTLSPRPEDYGEIFGGFHASRPTTIPVLDLPLVDEEEVFFDVRSCRFDYGEVFGGFDGLDFATSFEELLRQSNVASGRHRDVNGDSSEEAWTPAETASLSGDSDHSGKNRYSSNGGSYEPNGGTMEFDVSYHKVNNRSNGDLSNGITHIAQLHIPDCTFVVDETMPVKKTENKNPPLYVCDDGNLDLSGETMQRKHLRKTMSHPAKRTAGLQTFANDLESQRSYGKAGSFSDEMFVTISEINLKTQPSVVPPPSRAPPMVDGKKKDHENGQTTSSQETCGGNSSPPYFDVEIDASSAAATSAAAMKEAMEKAQVKLRSAKELMERKREGVQNSVKLGSKHDTNDKKEKLRKVVDGSRNVKDERVQDIGRKEDSGMKPSIVQKQEGKKTTQAISNSLEREKAFNTGKMSAEEKHGKESLPSQGFDKTDVADEWQEATQFFELVRTDKSKMVFVEATNCSVSDENTKRNEHQLKAEKAATALKQQEDSQCKDAAIREDHELEKVLNNLKTAKEACERGLSTARSEAAKRAHRHKGHEKKVKGAQMGSKREETEVKSKMMRPSENGKKPMGVQESQKHEKPVNGRENEIKFEVQQAVKHKEIEQLPKELSKSVENQKRSKECQETKDDKKRQREVFEWDGNDIKLGQAHEQAENEKAREEAHEQEEKEDTNLKQTCELEENENQEKEVDELDEGEMIWRKALEQLENEKRLKQALELEETLEKEKEACPKEEKQVLEQENNEKKHKGVNEKEAIEKRLEPDQHEEDKTEKPLVEAFELEDNTRALKEAQDGEAEMKRKHTLEQQKYEELKGINEVHLQTNKDEIGEKVKIDEGAHKHMEVEDLILSDKVHELDSHGKPELASNPDKNCDEQEEAQETVLVEESGTVQAEHTESEKRPEATEENLGRKFSFSGMGQDVANQLRMEDVSSLYHEDDNVKKADEVGIGIEQRNGEKIKSMSRMESYNEKQGIKFAYEQRERGKNINEAEAASNHEEDKDKFVPPQVVKESAEAGRRIEAVQSSVQEVKGDTLRTAQLVKISQGTEREEKNVSESLTPEEKETERMKREIELEKERLRKIEEEREREREREKDRMTVDRVTLEARERGYAEARERAERAAVERATGEARQRAMAEAHERLAKASAEARLRAERAAVERAATEAQERAVEKAMAERAVRVERSVSDKFSTFSRNGGLGTCSSSSDLQNQQFQSAGSFKGLRYCSDYNEAEGESPQRCKARLERYRRTAERAAKALAEKNMRDLLAQREQAERNRLAETLDADVKRWSSGKEGNLRALLSTLQYILGPDSGWQPIPLTEVITSAAVKKAYRKATLCVHPDKLQQRGASIQQKYICEKVFDLLKEAWNKFNSEER